MWQTHKCNPTFVKSVGGGAAGAGVSSTNIAAPATTNAKAGPAFECTFLNICMRFVLLKSPLLVCKAIKFQLI